MFVITFYFAFLNVSVGTMLCVPALMGSAAI
jgi:hypothetical protein